MRRSLLALVAALLVLVLLGLGGLAALDRGWQRDWLRRQVEAALADALGTPVSIGALDGVLHRGLRADGVRIGEPDAPLLDGLSLELGFGAHRWLGVPTLAIDALTLRGARLVLRRNADGRWLWDGDEAAADEDAPLLPFALRIAQLTLEDVRVVFVEDDTRRFELPLAASVRELGLDEAFSIGAAELTLGVAGPEPGGEPWLDGTASGSWRDGAWRVDQLALDGPLLSLRGAGHGDAEAIGASELQLRVPSLAALAARFAPEAGPLAGGLSLDAQLSGPYAWPLGHATLHATQFAAGDVGLGDVLLEARSEAPGRVLLEAFELSGGLLEASAAPGARILSGESRAQLEQLELRQPGGDGRLRVEVAAALPEAGGVEPMRDPGTRVRVRSEAWRLEALAPLWSLLGFELAGLLDADLELVGAPQGPRLSGRGSLSAGRFARPELSAEDVELAFDLSGPLAAPTGSVTGSASRVALPETELGALDLALAVRDGRLLEVERLSLSGGALALRVAPGARISLGGSGSDVAFEALALEHGAQRVELAGAFSGGAARDVRIVLAGLDVADTAQSLAGLGLIEERPELTGEVSGELLWNGPLAQPQLTGALAWSDVRLGEFDFDVIELEVETLAGQLELVSTWRRAGAAVLNARAELPLDVLLERPAALLADARASGQLDAEGFELGALAPLLPRSVSEIGGRLDAHFTLRGASPRPQAAGRIDVKDGMLATRQLAGQRLAPVALTLVLEGERIGLERLAIGKPDAGLVGRGELFLEGTRPRSFDLALDLTSFPIDAPGLVSGVLDGPLRLSGSPDDARLTGELSLAGLRVQIPEEDDVTLKEIRVVSGDADAAQLEFREETALPLLDPLSVDVALRIERNSWAKGRGADVELRGDLRATKAPRAALRYSGEIETVRGTYKLYGRRFRIERGSALFDGGEEIDPLLDVRAMHRVRDVRITVILEGRLSEVRVRFESTPELTDTDIASYLLFGRPAGNTGAGGDVALEAAAAQVAAGAALRELEQLFGGTLPVDMLDVRMEANGDTTEVRAGVGKYIGDRLYLHYERGFGAESEDELRAEYELTPNWSVESNVSPEGDTGADLIFELEY